MIRPPRPRANIAPPISLVHRNVLVRFRSQDFAATFPAALIGRDVIAPAADVVDQDVDRAEFGQGLFAGRLALVGLADVGLDRQGLATEARECRRRSSRGCRGRGRPAPRRPRHRRSPAPFRVPSPRLPPVIEEPLAVESKPIQNTHGNSFPWMNAAADSCRTVSQDPPPRTTRREGHEPPQPRTHLSKGSRKIPGISQRARGPSVGAWLHDVRLGARPHGRSK